MKTNINAGDPCPVIGCKNKCSVAWWQIGNRYDPQSAARLCSKHHNEAAKVFEAGGYRWSEKPSDEYDRFIEWILGGMVTLKGQI